MTNLLIALIGMIAIIPTKIVQVEIECYLCDSEASTSDCRENRATDVTCEGVFCSVTSYVRMAHDGCQ